MEPGNDNKKRLQQLLQLYYEGSADPSMLEELAELVRTATEEDMDSPLRQLWNEACTTPQTTLILSEEQSARIFDSIVSLNRKAIHYSGSEHESTNDVAVREASITTDEMDGKHAQNSEAAPRSTRIILRRFVIAAIIISVLIGAYYLFIPSTPTSLPASPGLAETEIRPGTEGAVLTLSDGTQITIDSNNNGAIASQGSVNITKNGNQLNYNGNGSDQVLNTMATPKGRKFSLQLADGSRVWLNASSSITFPVAFPGSERNVSIQGEVYFEIAHNKQQPFRVHVSDSSVIEVLGTHFNVHSYRDEDSVLTTLIEGSVNVVKGSRKLTLAPGQQAAASASTLQINSHPNIEQVMAWKNGYFSFQNADIKSVFRQVSRWYDIEIEYEENLPEILFSGEIGQNLSLSQVLSILDDTRIHYTLEGRKLKISN